VPCFQITQLPNYPITKLPNYSISSYGDSANHDHWDGADWRVAGAGAAEEEICRADYWV
jgi:hypothetical protein